MPSKPKPLQNASTSPSSIPNSVNSTTVNAQPTGAPALQSNAVQALNMQPINSPEPMQNAINPMTLNAQIPGSPGIMPNSSGPLMTNNQPTDASTPMQNAINGMTLGIQPGGAMPLPNNGNQGANSLSVQQLQQLQQVLGQFNAPSPTPPPTGFPPGAMTDPTLFPGGLLAGGPPPPQPAQPVQGGQTGFPGTGNTPMSPSPNLLTPFMPPVLNNNLQLNP